MRPRPWTLTLSTISGVGSNGVKQPAATTHSTWETRAALVEERHDDAPLSQRKGSWGQAQVDLGFLQIASRALRAQHRKALPVRLQHGLDSVEKTVLPLRRLSHNLHTVPLPRSLLLTIQDLVDTPTARRQVVLRL